MSISEEMRLDMIQKIKSDLKSVSYPQSFCPELYPNTNCLAYAIGTKIPDINHSFYFPGGIGGSIDTFYPSEMVENFVKDMKLLGINAEVISLEQAKETNKEGQIVALFYSYIINDFHFIRRDKEGGWSHKIGYDKPKYKAIPVKVSYNYERYYYEEKKDIVYDLIAFFNLSFL